MVKLIDLKVLSNFNQILFRNTALVFFLIILLAGFLRLYSLNNVPAGLNIDETSIGYNAYSLLTTGKDEYGVTMPITYKSFGDWKLIGYPFIAMFPIKLFGLNAFAVRLPSAIAGVAQVVLIYYICRLLFKKDNLALIISFFYAISPWSIYFSRIAYETNVALTFLLAGVYTLFKSIHNNESKWFIPSTIFFGITTFFYHSYIIVMPFFLLSVLFYFHKKIKYNKSTYVALFIFILLFSVVSYSVGLNSVSKFTNISVFNDPNVIYNRSDVFRSEVSSSNPIISKILYNKISAGVYQFSQNYFSTFSPQFLFDSGGKDLMSNLGYFGVFYLIDSIFLIVGLVMLIKNGEKYTGFLFIWALIAIIPSALTVSAPSSTRLFMILPPLIIIAGYGAVYLLERIKLFKFGLLIIPVILGLFAWNILLFIDGYFVQMNFKRAIFQHYGYQQAVELANSYPNYKVVMTSPNNFPYISFLFYTQYDPDIFRQKVTYYPENQPFTLVKGFDRYEFVDNIPENINAKNVLNISNSKPNKVTLSKFNTKGTIVSPSGEVIFYYFTNK